MTKDTIKQKQQWKPHPNAFLVENELKKSSITSDSELPTTLTPYFLIYDGSLCTINGAKNHADIVDHFREKLGIEPESKDLYIDGLGLFIDKTGLIRVRAHPDEILGLYKILDNGINQITIHSFRQFFRTYAGHHINRDYADSFIGHRFYLSEYENMPEEERKKIFLQLEPHMTLTGSKVQKHPKDPEVLMLQDQLAQLQEKIRILGIKYLQ